MPRFGGAGGLLIFINVKNIVVDVTLNCNFDIYFEENSYTDVVSIQITLLSYIIIYLVSIQPFYLSFLI